MEYEKYLQILHAITVSDIIAFRYYAVFITIHCIEYSVKTHTFMCILHLIRGRTRGK